MGQRLLLAASALVCLGISTPAAGQPVVLERPWLDPDARDYDQEEEDRSAFWDRASHPQKDLYENNIRRASRIIPRTDKQSRADAEALLRRSIEIDPDNPRAYWYLSFLQFRQKKYQACAAARTTIFRLEPDFKNPLSPRLAGVPVNLDFGLAQCLALSGKHERAIEHYKRILSRGGRLASNMYEVHWRLGEAYMALGRLKEAIGALRTARKINPREYLLRYALAGAYDRDEQLSLSRAELDFLRYRDSKMWRLGQPNTYITPPEDRYYFLGIARATPVSNAKANNAHARRLAPARALVDFRRFLAEHNGGPWARRTAHHIAELTKLPISPARVVVKRAGTIDQKKLADAITAANAALQKCVEKVPHVVFEVTITKLVKAGRRTPSPSSRPLTPGVRTRAVYLFATDANAQATATTCLDRAAAKIALPAIKGPKGSGVTIVFPVVKQ